MAPSPAALPTARMRGSVTGGTRPMIRAASGWMYEPKAPASITSWMSAGVTPITFISTLIPEAIDPLANCSCLTSF